MEGKGHTPKENYIIIIILYILVAVVLGAWIF